MRSIEGYGPTRQCAAGSSCTGCVKCAMISALIAAVRKEGTSEAAMELADRVDRLFASKSFVPGTAGHMVRESLEPVPAVFLDACDAAAEMKYGDSP